MRDTYFLFDIGGTHTRVSVSRNGNAIEEPLIYNTPQNFEEGIDLLKSAAKKFTDFDKIKSVSGCIAGPLSKDKTEIVNAPHLKEWNNRELSKELSKIFLNAPVYLENDAALEGLGEAVMGAGKGFPIVAYITLGTGIGGVRIVNGAIDANSLGFEPGHQIFILDDNDYIDWEEHASGSALEKKYSKKSSEIKDERVWEEEARILAVGLNNTIVFWSPDVVVLGGSVMKSIPIERVVYHLNNIPHIFSTLPPIKIQELKEKSGLTGALINAKDN